MDRAKMDGRPIEVIWWPESETCLRSDQSTVLEMSATYHGDRDEFWVVEYRWDGEEGRTWVEVARHNVRYLAGWKWAVDESTNEGMKS